MKRIVAMVVLAAVMSAVLALSASPAMAFHHNFIPAGECAAGASEPNASHNPTATEALTERAGLSPPIAPKGTPAEPVTMSTPAEENCTNA